MLVTDAVTVVLILLYFWYMTWNDRGVVSKPTTSYHSPQDTPLIHLYNLYDELHVSIDKALWATSMPDRYVLHDGKIVQQDACYGQTDGTQVPATGQTLYQMFQTDQLVPLSAPLPFETDALIPQQDKRIYYYTCQNGHIDRVHQCPPGTLFQNGECQLINLCTGQPDFIKMANPYDSSSYYLCQNEQTIEIACVAGSFFVHDNCRREDVADYCQHYAEPLVLDSRTLLVCQQGQVTYETCPSGFQYFDSPQCESDVCVGKTDGEWLPLPFETVLSLSYSPGYMICKADKVDSTHMCPSQWDRYVGDRLPFLPQVFDGTKCTAPQLCTNVTPTDPDIIIPVHEFTKDVRNWGKSRLFDQVTGYTCEGKKRKRVTLEPGQRIGKRMKRESACDSERAVVSNNFNAYYDCATQTVIPCPEDHFFNGVECQPSDPYTFKYKQIDMFTLQGLAKDNWIKPWDYSRKDLLTACTDPNFVLNKTYNLCSHPECVHYPFLSQIKFKIGHKDGSECIYHEPTRQMVKQTTSSHYLFWSQRKVPEPPLEDACTPGSHLQSGNFVLDATMFATCDEAQPFVFCPSSHTLLMMPYRGKWFCGPASAHHYVPPRTKREYVQNELRSIESSKHPTNIKLNDQLQLIPRNGLDLSKNTEYIRLETLEQGVTVYKKLIVTHPPDIVLLAEGDRHAEISTHGGGYLMKRDGFTTKALDFPNYEVKPSVPNFFIQSR